MRHLLAEHLLRGELHDPRLAGCSLTITEVKISPDLKNATVYTSELGGKLSGEVMAALQHAAPHLAGWLTREMHLRYAPRLRFVADETFSHAAKIDQLLRDAHRSPAGREDDDGEA